MQNNYLLECTDSISIENKISEIIDKNDFTNCYKSIYDLEEVSLDNALEDLDTYGFLSDKKVIIIKNCFCEDDDKKNIHLANYIENYNNDNLLILVTKKIVSSSTLLKKIKKSSNIEIIKIELNAIEYVKNSMKDYKIDSSTIRLLVELCKEDITRIDSECNKLKLYKIEDKEITKEDVELLVIKKLGDSTELLFSLVKHVISKDKKQAFKTYEELLEYKIDPYSIIGLMASQIRLIHQVKLLSDEKISNDEIANKLNKKVYQIIKTKEHIYNYTYKEIHNFIYTLANIDLAIKSGKLDNNLAIDMLIINT